MNILKICTVVSLAVWVGGFIFFSGVMAPVLLRRLGQEEAERILDILSAGVDRWTLVWSTVAAGMIGLHFMDRHFALRSLVLELPILGMLLLTWYRGWILHPQLRDLKRRLKLPQFQGTAHLETVRFSCKRLERRSKQSTTAIVFLGLFSLGLIPGFLT